MLETAGERNSHEKIRYRRYAMEDLDFAKESFDVVISSLAFHYVKDFERWQKRSANGLRRPMMLIVAAEKD